MPGTAAFGLFLTAAVILAITPGPGIFYVLTRSISGGRRAGKGLAPADFDHCAPHARVAAVVPTLANAAPDRRRKFRAVPICLVLNF